jgi:hypothetical protein
MSIAHSCEAGAPVWTNTQLPPAEVAELKFEVYIVPLDTIALQSGVDDCVERLETGQRCCAAYCSAESLA